MSGNDGGDTPPGTSPDRKRRSKQSKTRKRRRSTSTSSSSSEEYVRSKHRKTSSRLSTKDVLNLLLAWKTDNNKPSFSNNNMNNVVPEFDPVNRAQTIDCWLQKVNECAAIYGWDEKQTIHFSLQKLGGLAKKWFETLSTLKFSWHDWQTKLKRAFPSEENYGRLLEEMLSRTTRSEENLREYFYDKLGLLARCEIQGKKAVDCIVYGIIDKSIRNGAQALNCSEPEDLLNYLSSQKPQMSMQSRKHQDNDHTVSKDSTASKAGSSSSSLTCFNCHAKGHPFFKCPKPLIRCKRCFRVGHDDDRCINQPIRISDTTRTGSSDDNI